MTATPLSLHAAPVARAAYAAGALAETAAARDADRARLTAEFAVLREAGLLTATLPVALGGEGLGGPGQRHDLLRVLAHVGRGSLPVGRLYEGHVNALELVHTFGTDRQMARAADDAHAGHLFGVWNTEGPDGVTLTPTGDGAALSGAKTFCSGAGHVSRAFANATWRTPGDPRDGGWQMVLIPMDRVPAAITPDSWPAEGMRATASARIAFDGVAVEADALVGAPDDYFREPGFNGGAVRFAAVQLGGAEALLDAAVALLRQARRTADPHQRARLADAAIAVETGRLWLRGAAHEAEAGAPVDRLVAYARMTRSAIERVCLETIERVDRSVGARGLLAPHAVERIGRDLRLYLRQPAPDATLDAVGAAVLETDWLDARH